jgi:hypothetical protein
MHQIESKPMDNECWTYETLADIDESTWLYAAAHNQAFASLAEDSEDIYSLGDGGPFEPEA